MSKRTGWSKIVVVASVLQACWISTGRSEILQCPPLATCLPSSQARPNVPEAESKQKSADRGIESLIECCLAYCAVVNCNSPPATTACSPKFIRWSAEKYFRSSYGGNAYIFMKRNFLEGATRVRGIRIRQCQ